MKRGFTLIEMVVSTALILIIVTVISSLNIININMNRVTTQKDEQLNIVRAVCEKFKCETGEVTDKNVVIYVDGVLDMPYSITNTLSVQPNILIVDLEKLKSDNSQNKKYALLIQSSNNEGLNVIKATAFYMNNPDENLSFKVTRISEI